MFTLNFTIEIFTLSKILSRNIFKNHALLDHSPDFNAVGVAFAIAIAVGDTNVCFAPCSTGTDKFLKYVPIIIK